MGKNTKTLDPVVQKNVQEWLEGSYDSATQEQIRTLMQTNPQELSDAFYTRLDFGTGGLRGIMGVGTNRMNTYTVRFATQGLANYLHSIPSLHNKKHSVIVGYDSRHNSHAFAEEVAKVLAANDIEVFLFDKLRPVALVSFGLLHLKCTAGIMITASHNPPKYNGYKVYWSYGGQVLPPHDVGIIEEVNKVTSPSQVQLVDLPHPLIHTVGAEIDQAYLKATQSLMFYPEENQSKGGELHVVYTPLYGTGSSIVPQALKNWGFSHLDFVEEQMTPNGDFPHIPTPNPEEPAALAEGIKRLSALRGDLLIATDADTDRIGVVVLHQGRPVILNGNEMACMAVEHICQALQQQHRLPPKAVVIKTIVTSELFRKIAEHYQVQCLDVLTGFKYIGQKIYQWEEEKEATGTTHLPYHHFLFGAEESYGYLLGTHARDKDAVVMADLICEMALHQKLQGKTLVDLLHTIYKKYGVYREKLQSITLEGQSGHAKIEQIMRSLRQFPLQSIGGIVVDAIDDYLTRTTTYLDSGKMEPILLPKSDVLRFWLADGTKLVVRPSGTEPKIKLYCGVIDHHHFLTDSHALDKALHHSDQRCAEMLAAFTKVMRDVEIKSE